MRRLTVVLMGAVLLMVGCGSEPEPIPDRVSDGPPAPTMMEVTCAEDGTTMVADSELTVQEGGLHVRMDNQTGESVSMTGLGWDFEKGISTEVLPVPPGPLEIACWPYSDHEGGEEPPTIGVSILDPNGLWVDPEIDCTVGPESNVIFDHFFASPGKKGDPVDLARDVLHNLEDDDVVERAGYPAEERRVSVRVQRDGNTVATVYFDVDEAGGYLLGSANVCDATGINVR